MSLFLTRRAAACIILTMDGPDLLVIENLTFRYRTRTQAKGELLVVTADH